MKRQRRHGEEQGGGGGDGGRGGCGAGWVEAPVDWILGWIARPTTALAFALAGGEFLPTSAVAEGIKPSGVGRAPVGPCLVGPGKRRDWGP